jgi:hypothetical protein
VKAEKLEYVSDDDKELEALFKTYHSASLDHEMHIRQGRELHCILGLTPDGASDDAVENLVDSEARTELQRFRREKKRVKLYHQREDASTKLEFWHRVIPHPLPSVLEPGYPVTKDHLDWEYYYTILTAPSILEWRINVANKKQSTDCSRKFYGDQKTFRDTYKTLQALYASNHLSIPKDLPETVKKLENLFAYRFAADREEEED